ncbi:hypothetical protein GTY54_19890 [Streptomyces sp. SID625]|nr:hypothetical protein [Streptomyces sp. SID625]
MTSIFLGGRNHTAVLPACVPHLALVDLELLQAVAEYGITPGDGLPITCSSHTAAYDVFLPLPCDEYAWPLIADFVTFPASRHCDCYNNQHEPVSRPRVQPLHPPVHRPGAA